MRDLFTDKFFRIKAELLCYGVRLGSKEKKILRRQNPLSEKRGGLSSGGFFILENGWPVTTPIYEDYVNYSPYELKKEEDWVLYKNKEKICMCRPLPYPLWYKKRLPKGTPLPRIIQRHGKNQLASAIWSDCALFSRGEQCKFCLIGLNKKALAFKDPAKIREAVKIAEKENPCYELSLNAGMTYSPSRGSELFVKTVKAVREVSNIPIGLELAPPSADKYLEELASVGANSVMMNLEAYDDCMRQMICPGKYKLIPKERYVKAWNYSLKVFGEGQVSSVLLIGLEAVESTLKGMELMTDTGVIPDLLVYRPMDNTPLRFFPRPCLENVLYLYKKLFELLKEKGLKNKDQPGCLKCGGCSLTNCLFSSKAFKN